MVGDPSREDAAADAVPAVGALRIFRGAALVDDHRVALDTAVGVGELADASFRRTAVLARACVPGPLVAFCLS